MKQRINKSMLLMSSIFSFLFLLLMMMFSSHDVKAFNGNYDVYKLTIPKVHISIYSTDSVNKTYELQSYGGKEVDFVFYSLLPTRENTSTSSGLFGSDLNNIILFDSFYILGFRYNEITTNNDNYVIDDDMTFKELYDLVSYWWNFNSATTKSFDSYYDKDNEYDIKDFIAVNDSSGYSYAVTDIRQFHSIISDVYRNYENYIEKITEDYIVSSKQEIIDNYINDNNLYTEEEYIDYGNQKFEEGKESVDVTENDEQVIEDYINNNSLKTQEEYEKYGEEKFLEGQMSVDITSNDEEIFNNAYNEGWSNAYDIAFEEGKNSIDTSLIEKNAYERGKEDGFNLGYSQAESEIDITSDNDTVIHAYIKEHNYHTDFDFKLNFQLGYNSGINFVYNNIHNDNVVKEYVKDYIFVNKYKTYTEYIDNYDSAYKKGYSDGYEYGFSKGKENTYKNMENDTIIKEYWRTKIVNGMEINFINKGADKTYLIKNYDVNIKDTGDFKIIIHEGQDTFRVETIENVIPNDSPNNSNNLQNDHSELIDFFKNFGIVLLVFGVAIVGLLLLNLLLNPMKKKKNKEFHKSIKI